MCEKRSRILEKKIAVFGCIFGLANETPGVMRYKKCTIEIPLNPRGASKIKMLTDGVIVFKKKVIL